jgi:phage terminase large subunit-like protein
MTLPPPPPPEPGKTVKIKEKYEPLFNWPADTRYMLVTGGRGSSKSFSAATAIVCWMDREPGRKILFTRYTLVSAKDSIIPEFLEKIDLLGLGARFAASANEITHVNGSKIIFRGIKTSEGIQTAKLKSIQGINAWVIDEAEELPDEDVFDKIDLSIRDSRQQNRVILILNPAHKSHWIFNKWFSPERPRPARTGYIHTDYLDNLDNLPADYIAKAEECRALDPAKYARVWLGEWYEEIEGAICTYEMVAAAREPMAFPAMRRVVVAIDPAAKSTETSDDTGIVGLGLGVDGRFYVLGDETMKGTPAQWGRVAVNFYHRIEADRMIAENNNGGEMVEYVLRSIDAHLPYEGVHATRGKLVRAEPIAALYEHGKVSHCPGLAKLEAELMTFTGATTDDSPNRLDALVWAFWALMSKPGSVTVDLDKAVL